MDYSILNEEYEVIDDYLNNGNSDHKIFDNSNNLFKNSNNLFKKLSNVKNNYNNKIDKLEESIINIKNIMKEKWIMYNEIIKSPDKIDLLMDIILENSNKKIIIFNSFSNAFNKIIKELEKNNIFNYLLFDTGNIINANRCIDEFKNGNSSILFLDGMYSSHGINVEDCELLIMMHKMDDNVENQMIARAQRPGRKNQSPEPCVLRIRRMLVRLYKLKQDEQVKHTTRIQNTLERVVDERTDLKVLPPTLPLLRYPAVSLLQGSGHLRLNISHSPSTCSRYHRPKHHGQYCSLSCMTIRG